MNRGKFFVKLGLDNVKKNRGIYAPYILSSSFVTAMIYIMLTMGRNDLLKRESVYGEAIVAMMYFGVIVVSIFASIFTFYTNSFIIKRREKEFSLYNILGMNKRNISKIMLVETAIVGTVSIALGVFVGILFDKLLYMVLLKLIGIKANVAFYISAHSILISMMIYGAIFALTYLNSIRRIYTMNPMELLRSEKAGEREPKAKLIISILGFIVLGAGYYIAVTTQHPIKAMQMFFIAVVLVVIGTYMLFLSGSISLLKLLKKNKKLYYKTKNFISISGMLYRMKRNAAGLASICVLSTMVLVMTTVSVTLNQSANKMLNILTPNTIASTIVASQSNDEYAYRFNELMKRKIASQWDGDVKEVMSKSIISQFKKQDKLYTQVVIAESDYKKYGGESKIKLNRGESLVIWQDAKNDKSESILGKKYDIAGEIKKYDDRLLHVTAYGNEKNCSIFIVTDEDMKMLESEVAKQNAQMTNKNDEAIDNFHYSSTVRYNLGYDLNGDKEKIIKLYNNILSSDISNDIAQGEGVIYQYYSSRYDMEKELMSMTGILFFLSAFLGSVFIVEAIVIMYYKQITEGYEDREGFDIMQKVGLGWKEIKSSINRQILTVFFMPLAMAATHLIFAFPMLEKVMRGIGFSYTTLQVKAMAVTFVIFAALYSVIYILTAKAYYKIIK